MNKSVEIVLRDPGYKRNDDGFIIGESSEPVDTIVLAEMNDAKRSEFWQAQSVGVRVEKVFTVYSFEYSDQPVVIYDGNEYEIKRTYHKTEDRLELICARI